MNRKNNQKGNEQMENRVSGAKNHKNSMGKIHRFWIVVLTVIGGFSLMYFIFVFICLGPGSTFNYVWLLLAVFCGILAALVHYFAEQGKVLPKWVAIPIQFFVGIGFLLFIIIEAVIIHGSMKPPMDGADYLIILGAKVNGTQPSLILKYRIEAGIEYLRRNPDTMVIASGGQGADEGISEAQCIRQELIQAGIASERILLEEHSTSTKENLEYSAVFFPKETSSVVLTTTDFHLFRALQLARKSGYQNVSGNSAKSVWWLIPTNYTREFFAVVKEFVFGNIGGF